jgi:hypothetical protein
MSSTPLQLAFWRSRTRILLGALLALLAIATIVVWVRGDPPVRVTEIGFSRVRGVTEPDRGAGGISWAAVVENPRAEVAYGTTFRLTYHDDQGGTDDSHLVIVDALLPGQRLGIGGNTYDGDVYGMDGRVTSVDVEVDDVARWESPDEHERLTASDVWVGYSAENVLTVSFTAGPGDSERVTEARADAVLRNRDGEIVGGASGSVRPPEVPDGPPEGRIVASAEVPDVATAEVYLYTNDYLPS